MRVRDVMGDPVTVAADVPLQEVASLLVEREARGASVVDADGRLVGMVCDRDLVRAERGKQSRSRRRALGRGRSTGSARDAMRAPARAVEPAAPISSAVPLLVDGDPLSVVKEGRVVGLLTPKDVVRAVARPDEALARAIREQIRSACWSDPNAVAIGVERGRVTLSGRVDARATVALLPGVVLCMPGVASVESKLEWAGDERFR